MAPCTVGHMPKKTVAAADRAAKGKKPAGNAQVSDYFYGGSAKTVDQVAAGPSWGEETASIGSDQSQSGLLFWGVGMWTVLQGRLASERCSLVLAPVAFFHTPGGTHLPLFIAPLAGRRPPLRSVAPEVSQHIRAWGRWVGERRFGCGRVRRIVVGRDCVIVALEGCRVVRFAFGFAIFA